MATCSEVHPGTYHQFLNLTLLRYDFLSILSLFSELEALHSGTSPIFPKTWSIFVFDQLCQPTSCFLDSEVPFLYLSFLIQAYNVSASTIIVSILQVFYKCYQGLFHQTKSTPTNLWFGLRIWILRDRQPYVCQTHFGLAEQTQHILQSF